MPARVNPLSWQAVATAEHGNRRLVRGCAIVAVSSAVVFARTLGFGFVFDDHWTIERNEWLSGPLLPILSSVVRGTARAANIADSTRPTMIVSTWIDRHLFGLAPLGFHAHSLLAYVVTVAVAAWVLLELSGRPRQAFVGAMFFALAPVHAEVVASINYREDLLSAIGVLVPLGSLLARRARPESFGESVAIAAAWGMGLLAKESATALLPLLVLAAVTRPDPREWLRRRERSLVCLEAVFILWINWRLALALAGDDIPRAVYPTLANRLVAFARFETRALASSLFPFLWSPEHARQTSTSPLWALLLLGIVGAIVLAFRRRSLRVPATGMAFALLAALPSSPLTAPINETADRYFFLGVLGGGLFWGWVAESIARRIPRLFRAPVLLVLALPFALTSQSAARPWASDEALWTTAVVRAPRSARAWTGLARMHRLAGELDAADRALARAFELDPGYMPARVTEIYNRLARGDVDGARQVIAQIRASGGTPPLGMKKAVACAAHAPEEAKACIVAASR
jgi:hypothetical protein